MTTGEIVNILLQGREIEFSLDGHAFFLAPLYSDGMFSNKYTLYDVVEKRVIYTGELNEILVFEFSQNVSLEKSSHRFSFEYIM